jgi:hypothetical protein
VSDIDTAAADSLKVLDPKRPIGEADIRWCSALHPYQHLKRIPHYLFWFLTKLTVWVAGSNSTTRASAIEVVTFNSRIVIQKVLLPSSASLSISSINFCFEVPTLSK